MNQAWIKYLPEGCRPKVEGMQCLQAVVSNTGWLLADNIVRMVIGLLISIWFSRYLGPDRFGIFSYALAFVALFSPLASLGLDDIAVRELVRDPGSKNVILGTAFILKLAGGAVSFLSAIVAIVFLRSGDSLAFWLVAVISGGAIFQAMNTVEFWFTSQVQAKYPVIAKNLVFLICTFGKLALIMGGAHLLAFAWIALLETILGAAGLVVAYRVQGLHIKHWNVALDRAAALLKDSWPLLFSCVVIVMYLRINQVMLGEMAGSQAVGIYSVAVRFTEVWIFFSSAVYWSVLPGLIAARAAGEALFYARLQKYYNFMAFAAYAIAIPIMFSAKRLVPALFGQDYADAGPILAILVWSNLFMYLDSARSAFFNIMNLYRLYLLTLVLGAVLNMLLNLYLIPRYGGLGAAAASCIAYWFAVHGSCFLYQPLHKVGFMLTRALIYPKIW